MDEHTLLNAHDRARIIEKLHRVGVNFRAQCVDNRVLSDALCRLRHIDPATLSVTESVAMLKQFAEPGRMPAPQAERDFLPLRISRAMVEALRRTAEARAIGESLYP